jgi:hypothetical protein
MGSMEEKKKTSSVADFPIWTFAHVTFSVLLHLEKSTFLRYFLAFTWVLTKQDLKLKL